MSNRFFDGEPFPEDFFPGAEGEFGEFEGDEFDRTFDLEERELDQRLLIETVKALEMSVANWKFLDSKSQRKMIRETFLFYQGLLDGSDEEPEEEETEG